MKNWHAYVFGLLAAPTCALAGRYAVEERVTDQGSAVTIVAHGHRIPAPRTEPDQQGSGQAKVSPDGRTVGWVAETGNCCTSYPLPTALVLYRHGKIVRRIPMVPPIFDWAFGPGPDEVVTQQEFPHGPEYLTFTRLRISDGRKIAEYTCNQDAPDPEPRPGWSRIVDRPCPEFVPPPPDDPASTTRKPAAD